MKKGKNFFSGATISSRLLLGFLVSTLIPTIIITGLLCLRYDTNYRSTAQTQMQISRDLIEEYLNSYFSEINAITSAPYYHSYFSSRESLDVNDTDYQQEVASFQEEMQSLVNLTTLSHSDISDLIIWSDGQYLYFPMIYNELWYFSNRLVVEEQPWYSHAMSKNGRMVFTPVAAAQAGDKSNSLMEPSAFFVTRRIRNLRQPEQVNLVIMNLNTKPFDTDLKELELLYDSFVVISNEQDELIYSSKALTGEALADILSGENFRYDGSRWNSISSDIDGFLLTVHLVFSLDDVSRHTTSLIYSAIGIYLAGILLALALFYRFNKWIANSTSTLQATFLELESGNLEAQCPPVAIKEFNQIGNSINDVIAKLNEKIKNEYLMTIRQKNLQLYALQSQIQPHFLINTIYNFIALNQIGETKKLNASFYNLAHLLRYVLSKEPHTTIGRENAFLEDYLKLQHLRFGERLSYEIDCPEEFKDIQIPRLLLQPLVENAIIHGIEPCEHPCLCRIRVFKAEEQLHILIEENGVGFDAEEIKHKAAEAEQAALLQSGLVKDKKTSVGMYYVRERMKMWSERATLSIRREELTIAEIQIPWEEVGYESSDC